MTTQKKINLKSITFCAVFIFTILSLQSCYESKTVSVDVPAIDCPINNESSITDAFKHFHFIQLETTDNCLITDIKKVYDVHDTLVVLNKNTDIFTFHKKDGRFIRSLSARGEGPDEYAEATDVTLAADGILVIFDRLKNKLLYLSLDGAFVKSEEINRNCSFVFGAEATASNKLLLVNYIAGTERRPENAYVLMNESKNAAERLIDNFDGIKVGEWMTCFTEKPTTKTQNGITFIKMFNDTIFHIDKTNNISPLFTIKTKLPMASREVFFRYGEYEGKALMRLEKDGNYCPGLSRVYETNRYLVAEPVFVQEDGYYWIDKKTLQGTFIPAGYDVNTEIDKMIQGRSIIQLIGSMDNEMIACLDGRYLEVLKKELNEHREYKPFDKRLKAFVRKADTEGNPCLIFYEH